MSSEAHRVGPWKQTNKGHKSGRHRSKGAVEKENRGRISAKVISKKGVKVTRKLDRKNHLNQARRLARQEAQAKKRSIGAQGCPPVLVALIPLAESQEDNIQTCIDRLTSCMPDAEVSKTESGVTHLTVPRYKQRFSFIIPTFHSLYEILDITKACDSVFFLLCPHTGMSERGELVLTSVLAQSLPTDPVMVLGPTDEIQPSRLADVKRLMVKVLERKYPAERIYTLNTDADALVLVRALGTQKRRYNVMRERRGHLMAESVKYIPAEDGSGSLQLTGFVRGKEICINRLVHVPGLGDFQLSKIEKLVDPCQLTRRNEMEDLCELLPDEKQEDLEMENVPDGMEGEQTWPTDEELKEAEENVKKKTRVVPVGTSEYQAAWILDGDEDEDSKADGDNQESDDEDEDMDDELDVLSPAEGTKLLSDDEFEQEDTAEEELREEMEEVSMSEAASTGDYDAKHVNFSEEVNEMERLKQARTDAMFPDEVDTPIDMPARVRFQKYRGLKSLRTSVWDPKENLPYDYARIFQFENFLRTRKRVLGEEVVGGAAEVGWYVRLHLKGVGVHLKPQIEGRVLTACSLLPHEQRMSVINLAVKRSPLSDPYPVKSKERLVFHCGWRRFAACPIFSEHSTGNKHKYERFFREGDTVVMSMFAPITFPPAPVLVFHDLPGGRHNLLGSGTLLNVDPDRVVVKRTVLSGHSFKIHKTVATVRFMFFNREDVNWFKPIQLRTKQGRRGHIKEALGTHGHMKCIFDGPISQQDTVLLNLYKRVFPKWTYDGFVADPSSRERSQL